MPLWLSEHRVIRPLSGVWKRFLCFENWSGHSLADKLKTADGNISNEICYFPQLTCVWFSLGTALYLRKLSVHGPHIGKTTSCPWLNLKSLKTPVIRYNPLHFSTLFANIPEFSTLPETMQLILVKSKVWHHQVFANFKVSTMIQCYQDYIIFPEIV